MTVINILDEVRNWLENEICENFTFKKDPGKEEAIDASETCPVSAITIEDCKNCTCGENCECTETNKCSENCTCGENCNCNKENKN